VELRNTLGDKFGIELPPSLALDFPTASAIAGHIASLAAPVAVMSAASEHSDAAPRRALQGTFARDAAEPTAIVGLSARFPSGIRSAAQFWGTISSSANLQDQVRDCEFAIKCASCMLFYSHQSITAVSQTAYTGQPQVITLPNWGRPGL
jgi:Phosphopantetheine attachment site